MTSFELISFLAILIPSVSVTVLFAKIIEPGEILGFYGKWLDRKGTWTEGNDGKKLTTIDRKTFYEDGSGKYEGETVDKSHWWYKPLGGCVICVNFWQSIGIALVMRMDILELIAFAAISHLLIRIIYEKLI